MDHPPPPPPVPVVEGVTRRLSHVVKSGNHAMIKKVYEESMKMVQVAETETNIGRSRVRLHGLIGGAYGQIYSLDKKNREFSCLNLPLNEVNDIYNDNNNSVSTGQSEKEDPNKEQRQRDNRNIHDDGSSQKLTYDDIRNMKDRDMSQQDIISTLVENSSTFKEKTSFSQAKYLKKKREKYSNFYTIMKPSVKLMCEMLYNSGPGKGGNLRPDTLSQMLNGVNVHSGGRYIVLDNYMGLLAAAVIDRLIGSGAGFPESFDPGLCIQVYLENGPVQSWRECIDALDLPPHLLSQSLVSCPIRMLHDIEQHVPAPDNPDRRTRWKERMQKGDVNPNGETSGESPPSLQEENEVDKDPEENGNEKRTKRKKWDEKFQRREDRKREESRLRCILMEQERIDIFDGFLMITRTFDPKEVCLLVIKFLSPSSPFCIYCPTMEPLAEVMMALKPFAINMRVTETWMRKYQILPDRSRPDMMMSGSGGYLLTGTKIVSSSSKKQS